MITYTNTNAKVTVNNKYIPLILKGDSGRTILYFNKITNKVTKLYKLDKRSNSLRVFYSKTNNLDFIFKRFKHPNIVEIMDVSIRIFDNVLKQTFEICEKGDLYNSIYVKKLPTDILLNYYLGVLDGVKFMHSLNFIHNDIKPENICITRNGVPKIIDINYHNCLNSLDKYETNMTITYCPTELLHSSFPDYMNINSVFINMRLNKTNDIWALGCMLHEILFRDLPWNVAHINDSDYSRYFIYAKFKHELAYIRFDDYQLTFVNIVKGCLNLVQDNRYRIDKLQKDCNRALNTINAFYSV